MLDVMVIFFEEPHWSSFFPCNKVFHAVCIIALLRGHLPCQIDKHC